MLLPPCCYKTPPTLLFGIAWSGAHAISGAGTSALNGYFRFEWERNGIGLQICGSLDNLSWSGKPQVVMFRRDYCHDGIMKWVVPTVCVCVYLSPDLSRAMLRTRWKEFFDKWKQKLKTQNSYQQGWRSKASSGYITLIAFLATWSCSCTPQFSL